MHFKNYTKKGVEISKKYKEMAINTLNKMYI